MFYRCPSFRATGTHCLYECPEFGWYGFQRCLTEHKHNTPCSGVCLGRIAQDAAYIETLHDWQRALLTRHAADDECDRVEANARDALRTGEGLWQALADMLVKRIRQKAAKAEAEDRKLQ
ncbi:hypothetical protein MMC32_008289 [Xylographa parallela]|nr:hypothetical protein [Xylographa parallela]